MRCFFLTGLLVLSCLAGGARAQQPATAARPPALRPAAGPEPIFILNTRLIIGGTVLADLNPNVLERLEVYKGGAETPARWRSLAPPGIISVTLKPTFRLGTIASQSLRQIQRKLRLSGAVGFELDGRPLEDHTLRIATAAIAGLDVRREVGAAPVVDIRLVRPVPRPAPPGIYLRGLSPSQR